MNCGDCWKICVSAYHSAMALIAVVVLGIVFRVYLYCRDLVARGKQMTERKVHHALGTQGDD